MSETNQAVIKPSPRRGRVLTHLADNGPSTIAGLSVALGIKIDTLNAILSALLALGDIERCAIGNMSGVRISEAGATGESEE